MNIHYYVRTIFPVISLAILVCSSNRLCGETIPDKCRLKPINGSCKAMMEKYYFNLKTGKCMEYTYDGCGAVVPFDTLDDCRALCESVDLHGKQGEMPGIKPIEKKDSGLAHDPVEDDPRYAEVFKSIDGEVKALLADHPQRGGGGFVNIHWIIKKDLLKQKYNIDWRSPEELNPHVLFD
jgi:hypothetical protein